MLPAGKSLPASLVDETSNKASNKTSNKTVDRKSQHTCKSRSQTGRKYKEYGQNLSNGSSSGMRKSNISSDM